MSVPVSQRHPQPDFLVRDVPVPAEVPGAHPYLESRMHLRLQEIPSASKKISRVD